MARGGHAQAGRTVMVVAMLRARFYTQHTDRFRRGRVKLVDGAILLIVALAALGAFVTGVILLVLYFRSGRDDQVPSHEPVVYGNLVQCPQCGYMNPLESAACLNPNCRAPLPHPQMHPTYLGDQPQPAAYAQAPVAPPPAQQAAQQSAQLAPQQSPQPSQPAQASQSPQSPQPQPPATPAASAASPHRTVQRSGSASERPPGMPNAWLEGLSGVMQGKNAVLQQGDTLVGRSTVCDVQVYDPKVSRKHFRIRYGNGAFFLQDQQSSRGTRINGERVMAQRLNDGDQIVLGDTALVFHVEQ